MLYLKILLPKKLRNGWERIGFQSRQLLAKPLCQNLKTKHYEIHNNDINWSFCFECDVNAQTNEEQIVIFSRIGELCDEQLNNAGASKLTVISDRTEAEKMAKLDIQNGIPFLLLMGGVAPTIISTDPTGVYPEFCVFEK